jgi:hypothetical protein
MLLETTIGAAALGFLAGFLAGRSRVPKAEPRPMRLVRVHETIAPGGPVAQSWSESEMWRLSLTSFMYHGNVCGFSYRAMGPEGAGVVRRAAWQTFSTVLREAGVLVASERSTTSWAGGWTYPKARAALKHGLITPPCPAGKPPMLLSGHWATLTIQRSTVAPGATGAGGHARAH